MDASALTNQIIIQTYTTTRDAIGGTNEEWSNFATVYTNARSVRSQDRYASARVLPIEAYEFTIRWLENLDSKMQILFRSKTYKITGIIPSDDRAWIKIMAEGIEQGKIT